MSIRLSRRTVLRGAGGVAVGLPVLEAMLDANGEAFAQGAANPPGTTKKKLLLAFCGQSTGTGAGANTGPSVHFTPGSAGPRYDLTGKTALAPLEPVRDQTTVVTGLRIPTATVGAQTPAGGWSGLFHNNSWVPLLTGGTSVVSNKASFPTADHLAARALEADKRLPLALRVQAGGYGTGAQRGILSYRQNPDGTFGPHAPLTSPEGIWSSLFKGLPPTANAGAAATAPIVDPMRRGVVDAVKERTRRLMTRLGSRDRARMDEHLQQIVELERRVNEPPKLIAGCVRPDAPGADPAVTPPVAGKKVGGWGDEEKRAKFICDAVRMAFVCDQARVASLMFTYFQSFMASGPITGSPSDVHELSHGGAGGNSLLAQAKMLAWHSKWFAYLVQQWKGTADVGGTLLDNSVIVMLYEGGYGQTPEDGGKAFAAHSTENMAVLYATGASAKMKGLKVGQHVVTQGKHPAAVQISILEALGAFPGAEKKMGEVSGVLPELFG